VRGRELISLVGAATAAKPARTEPSVSARNAADLSSTHLLNHLESSRRLAVRWRINAILKGKADDV
jgi:hypothetical protein